MLLGSVSQHVTHHAPCPVVIVRDTVEQAMGQGAATAATTTAGAATADAIGTIPAAADAENLGTAGEHIGQACLADELGAALVQLFMVLRRAILPPQISLTQASTLLILRDEGPQRVTSLAEAAQVTQPTMSGLVIGMERLGWVRRGATSTDRRAVAGVPHRQRRSGGLRNEASRSRALLADIEALTPRDRAALVAALPALRGIIAHEQQSKDADKDRTRRWRGDQHAATAAGGRGPAARSAQPDRGLAPERRRTPPGEAELGTDGPGAIVVGVDGTPTSLRALAYAAGMARRQRAQLIAVYVRSPMRTPVALSGWVDAGIVAAEAQAQHDAEAEVWVQIADDGRLGHRRPHRGPG